MELKTFETVRRDYSKDEYGEKIERTFDAVDTKGRVFGASVRPFSCEYKPETCELWDTESNRRSVEETNRTRKAGHRYFGFRPHATRGGKSYGASQGERIFETAEQRDAAIAKYFATAEKGALTNKARAN